MGQSIEIHRLIKKGAELSGKHKAATKAVDAIKADLDAIDCALVLCGYEDDPKGMAPRGKYKQLLGRNELKLTIVNTLRQAPAPCIQRQHKNGHVVQDFGPDGCLWKLAP
ncbi:hypothetical protein [Ruegeria sp. MALMAid1280]|uniref:hypothetical protein n=1 Tax=Ruegeria sp. MALMAid1280 TaxID=3411634 RepID=UPI003BA338D7